MMCQRTSKSGNSEQCKKNDGVYEFHNYDALTFFLHNLFDRHFPFYLSLKSISAESIRQSHH